MFCSTPSGFFARHSAVTIFTRARSKGAPTRNTEGDVGRRFPTQFQRSRICVVDTVLCARNRSCLLCPGAGRDRRAEKRLPCLELFAHTALKKGSELPNREDHAFSLRNSSQAEQSDLTEGSLAGCPALLSLVWRGWHAETLRPHIGARTEGDSQETSFAHTPVFRPLDRRRSRPSLRKSGLLAMPWVQRNTESKAPISAKTLGIPPRHPRKQREPTVSGKKKSSPDFATVYEKSAPFSKIQPDFDNPPEF